MEFMSYENYDQYRKETNRRQPHTEKRFREKLDKKIDGLYMQRDYRSLEMLIELVEALQQGDEDQQMDLYFTVSNLLRADKEQMHRLFLFVRTYMK